MKIDFNVKPSVAPIVKDNSVCIAIYAYGAYQKYIPLYVFSIMNSYPNYSCLIFHDEDLNSSILNDLKMLNSTFGGVEIVELQDEYYTLLKKIFIENECRPAIRWFLPIEELKRYDYVYYGDVDFLIVPEIPSLSAQHIMHMHITELPFSNIKRKGEKRLTGLHFVKTKQYFNKIYSNENISIEIINKWLKDKPNKGVDEFILYKIITNSMSIESINKIMFRPYHGFHFAASREPMFEFYFNDDRHSGNKNTFGNYGWVGYSRKKLIKTIKELHFKKEMFNELYNKRISDDLRKLRLLINGPMAIDDIMYLFKKNMQNGLQKLYKKITR